MTDALLIILDNDSAALGYCLAKSVITSNRSPRDAVTRWRNPERPSCQRSWRTHSATSIGSTSRATTSPNMPTA